jgi:hypothetical protein
MLKYAVGLRKTVSRRFEIIAQELAKRKSLGEASIVAGYRWDTPSFEANARQRASCPKVKSKGQNKGKRASRVSGSKENV